MKDNFYESNFTKKVLRLQIVVNIWNVSNVSTSGNEFHTVVLYDSIIMLCRELPCVSRMSSSSSPLSIILGRILLVKLRTQAPNNVKLKSSRKC